MNQDLLIAGGVGLAAGWASAHFLFGPTASLVVWGFVGIGLGCFVEKGKREILFAGALYGFFLSISFLFAAFGGTADKLFAYTIFTLAMSVVGMLGGVVSVGFGSWLRKFRS